MLLSSRLLNGHFLVPVVLFGSVKLPHFSSWPPSMWMSSSKILQMINVVLIEGEGVHIGTLLMIQELLHHLWFSLSLNRDLMRKSMTRGLGMGVNSLCHALCLQGQHGMTDHYIEHNSSNLGDLGHWLVLNEKLIGSPTQWLAWMTMNKGVINLNLVEKLHGRFDCEVWVLTIVASQVVSEAKQWHQLF